MAFSGSQTTMLSAMATPGQPVSFSAKEEASTTTIGRVFGQTEPGIIFHERYGKMFGRPSIKKILTS